MNRVFGKKKAKAPAGPAPSLSDASSGVGGHMDSMDAKIAQLDKELKVYRDKLKTTKNPSAKKQLQKRAVEVLKRKRMYETQRENLAGQQFNIDQAAFQVESAKASVSTVAAMKSANAELKHTIRTELNVDDVDDLADDMAELMEDFGEINEALGRNFATPEDIDEADLEAELGLLEDELEEEGEYASGASASVPSYLQESPLPAQPTSAPGSGGRVPVAAGGGGGRRVDEYGLPLET